MKNQVVPFFFGAQKIRVVSIGEETWFVAKDVAEVLGYTNPSKAIGDHCKGVAKRYPLETPGGVQELRIIREPDLYRLIVGSTLPAAVRFEAWVFEEVLPALRQNGRYELSGTRSRADIFHHRGPVSESGLDIRYALDLTRIALNPNPRTLALVQRLTGVELGDLIEETEREMEYAGDEDWADQVASRFLAECVRRSPGACIRAARVYAFFREWYGRQGFPAENPIPSMKSLNKRLCRAGFAKEKISWYMFHDLAIVRS